MSAPNNHEATIRDNGTRSSPHERPSFEFQSSVGICLVMVGFLLAYLLPLAWDSPSSLHVWSFQSIDDFSSPPTEQLRTSHGVGIQIAAPPTRFDQDYGGLNIVSLAELNATQREINPNDWEIYEKERHALIKEMEEEEQELPNIESHDHDDELNHPRECERNNWRSSLYLNCNAFHELVQVGTEKCLGEGFFRNTWLVKEHHHGSDNVFVLKRLKLPHEDEEDDWFHRGVHAESLSKTQREAIMMGSLKGSPRIVDIYGFCGTSITAENMPDEIGYQITPGDGDADKAELDAMDHVHPMNNFTLEEKLDLAINMTASIAELHGFEGGLMFHGDIRPDQWLVAPDGSLKLNDFNTAEVADWDMENEDYCVMNRRRMYGVYRSPEEFQGDVIDEKVDIYSMGNTLYALLTGLHPFYEVDYDSYAVIKEKVVEDSALPYVDERYRTNSFIESRIVDIMEDMWEYEPDDRPNIFEVVEYLRETKQLWRQCGNTTSTIDEISPDMFDTCEIAS